MIPVGFGVQKVAGAMIWATDIDEDKNTRKEGGSLFGGGQKIVEYRYFATFAVAFGEGPAGGVLRLGAGDRLIADLRAGAGAYANHPKYRFRIYLGTEDQEPDRLIRQHVEGKLGDDHILWLASGVTPNLRHDSNTGTVTITSSVSVTNDTAWHTLVATWRPRRLELYLDGISRANRTAANTNTSDAFGIYRWG